VAEIFGKMGVRNRKNSRVTPAVLILTKGEGLQVGEEAEWSKDAGEPGGGED
jgi:hypothetical protein